MTEFSPDSILSHYRILSKIGEGGMGEVYLAQDTKLDRRVALKILPVDVASDQSRMRRFVQEAKAASPPRLLTLRPTSSGAGPSHALPGVTSVYSYSAVRW